MTLFEIMFIFCTLTGTVIGAWLGASYGETLLPGLLVGAGLGAVAGVVFYGLLGMCLFQLARFTEWWRPHRPPCRQGRCGPDDYEFLQGREDVSEADKQLSQRVIQEHLGYLYRCRCGDRYVRCDRSKWLEVAPDGTMRPYRYHKPFGRKWLPA
jgi:hypothetical protein